MWAGFQAVPCAGEEDDVAVQRVAACLQCVAASCNELQLVAVCCSVIRRRRWSGVEMCCSVLQSVRCTMLQCALRRRRRSSGVAACCSVLQRVAV